MKKNNFFLAYIYLIIATGLWGGNVLAAKIASNIFLEPIKLSFYRNLVAAIIIFPFIIKKLIKDKSLYLLNWKIIVLLSIFSVSIFNTFLNIALTTSTVISSSLMPAFAPSLIIILSFIILHNKISFFQFIGVIISIFGFIAIVVRGDLSNFNDFNFVRGDLWMLLAVISWSLYSVLLKKINKNIDTLIFLFLIFFIGNFIITPFFIIESYYASSFLLNEKFSWYLVLYVGIGPALIAYLFWIKSVQTIGVNKSSLFLNLIPIFSSTISIIFLGEVLKIYHIIGAILIFIGIYLVTKESK